MRNVTIRVQKRDGTLGIVIGASGMNLRKGLLENGFSPYPELGFGVHCGGMGVCGTCRVGLKYDGMIRVRRSCEVRCFEDLEIQIL